MNFGVADLSGNNEELEVNMVTTLSSYTRHNTDTRGVIGVVCSSYTTPTRGL